MKGASIGVIRIDKIFLFSAKLYNLLNKDVCKRKIYLVELLRIEKYVNKPFMIFSSGIKQQLSIAKCLLYNPPVFIMDESTKSLDPAFKLNLQNFVKKRPGQFT
jgi:ABC-type Na+ transport system ATPase subunit NatA